MPIRITLCILTLFVFSVASVNAKTLDQVQWRAKPGTVALTFDDGPNPKYTPQILKILKDNHIHATFFVMGWSAYKYPNLIKQIVAQGHAVANHSMSHPKLTRLSTKRLHAEVVKPAEIIDKIIGKRPVCLRPPFGMGNARVDVYIRKQGMIMVPMGFNSFDYQRRGVQKLTNWVVKNAHSGMVILLHDGPKYREQTVKALPGIIKGIRNKGLSFSVICRP